MFPCPEKVFQWHLRAENQKMEGARLKGISHSGKGCRSPTPNLGDPPVSQDSGRKDSLPAFVISGSGMTKALTITSPVVFHWTSLASFKLINSFCK